MPSLDVDPLFNNVPLDETIDICVKELFKTSQRVSGINKQQVSLTIKGNTILFDEYYYSQNDGVAMASPFGPTLANVFLCHHKTKSLRNFPKAFKPVYYKRYVSQTQTSFTFNIKTSNFRFKLKEITSFLFWI